MGNSTTEINTVWPTVTIKDITTLIKDGTHGTHKEAAGGIPLLSAKDINYGKITFDNKPRLISEEDFNAIHKSYKLTDGDVLLTIVGTLGRVARVVHYDNNYTLQRSVSILRFKDSVDSDYMYHTMTGGDFQKEILKRESKGAQGGIYLGEIAKIKINLPDISEQRRIVAVLDTWDTYLEKLDKEIVVKNNIKKSLMQQLLAGKTRISGFNNDWEVVKLGDISRIKTGKKDNQNKVKGGAYPFFVRSPNIERIDSYSFDGEAILVPGEGNIGKIFHYINGKFDFHQRVYKISDFDKSVSGKYIHYYFVHNFAREVSSGSVKATVDSLRLPTFTNFKIYLPPREEQDAIVDILDTISGDIELLLRKKMILKSQKKYLVNNLISGKLRTPENLTISNTEAQHA